MGNLFIGLFYAFSSTIMLIIPTLICACIFDFNIFTAMVIEYIVSYIFFVLLLSGVFNGKER